MKTITIKQPWASLIVSGIKDVENRTWPTKFRGRVLIHAGAKIDKNAVDKISHFDAELARKVWFDINNKKLITGAVVGSVEIVDCTINHYSIWAEKTKPAYSDEFFFPVYNKPTYNWVLSSPIKFPEPIPAKGKLSFWKFDTKDVPYIY